MIIPCPICHGLACLKLKGLQRQLVPLIVFTGSFFMRSLTRSILQMGSGARVAGLSYPSYWPLAPHEGHRVLTLVGLSWEVYMLEGIGHTPEVCGWLPCLPAPFSVPVGTHQVSGAKMQLFLSAWNFQRGFYLFLNPSTSVRT